MADKELFKHVKYIKQLKSERTGIWSFKVFVPYEKDGEKQTYTKTFSSNKYQSSKDAFNAAIICKDKFLLDLKTIGVPKQNIYTVFSILEKSFEMGSISPETIRKKKITFTKWINHELREKRIQDVNAADIQMSLADASRSDNISQGILDDLYCIWKQIFKTALKMDIIYRNPFDQVDKLKINKVTNIKRAYETDLDTLLKVCDAIDKHTKNVPWLKYNSKILTYALKVSWFTALRPAEVLALEHQHVSMKYKTLYVRQEVGMDSNREPIIRSPKTAKSNRNIPLTNEAVELFKEIIRFQKSNKYLFADYNGCLFNSTYTADKIKKSCDAENIEFNWYCLRHQYSTDMQRNNESLSITAKGMGHENINMSYQYTRMNDEDLRAAMTRLGRSLSK